MLTPGPELDRLVAEACGLRIRHAAGGRFQPSADLNDAFLAAEKVGLFDDRNGGMCLVGHWYVAKFDQRPGDPFDPRPAEATPALAICAAILRLKEQSC